MERRRNSQTSFRLTGAALASALIIVSASASAGALTDPEGVPDDAAQVQAPVPDINWGDCGDGLEAFECATVQVPTDYDEPEGDTTNIALMRAPATDPDNRIGSLFLNFGGPGGPGIDGLMRGGPTILGEEVAARFDVIGFDPRGVGQSDPITCFANQEAELAAAADRDIFPTDDPAAEAEFIDKQSLVSVGCELLSGDRIEHASTANVARDMDLLRQAVGDEQLTYVGYSYGTLLGATYSALFPDRVRAMVLDGTVDPPSWFGGEGSIGNRIGMGEAGAEAFEQFLALCEEGGPEKCSLAGYGDPGTLVDEVFSRLQDEPVEIEYQGAPLKVTYDFMVIAAFGTMYSPYYWGELSDVFVKAGEATGAISAPTTMTNGPNALSDGPSLGDLLRELGLIEDYPSIGAMVGAACTDATPSSDPFAYPAAADEADESAPHFGRSRAWWGIECEFVPFQDEDAYKGPWEQQTDTPVLVIGTRYDPATAYKMTQPYADRYPNARMLTIEGYGHGSYGVSGCAAAAITTYLIDVEATDGTVCGQDIAPFEDPPQGLDQQMVDLRLLMARATL